MDLTKKDERGMGKVLYNKVNKLSVIQWVNNKVVSCTSTLSVYGLAPVSRRSGSNVLDLRIKKHSGHNSRTWMMLTVAISTNI